MTWRLDRLDTIADPTSRGTGQSTGRDGLIVTLGDVAVMISNGLYSPDGFTGIISVTVLQIAEPHSPTTHLHIAATETNTTGSTAPYTGNNVLSTQLWLGQAVILDHERIVVDWVNTAVVNHRTPVGDVDYFDYRTDYGATVITWDGTTLRVGDPNVLRTEFAPATYQPPIPPVFGVSLETLEGFYTVGPILDMSTTGMLGMVQVGDQLMSVIGRSTWAGFLHLFTPLVGPTVWKWFNGFDYALVVQQLHVSGDVVTADASAFITSPYPGMAVWNATHEADQAVFHQLVGAVGGAAAVIVMPYIAGLGQPFTMRALLIEPSGAVSTQTDFTIAALPDEPNPFHPWIDLLSVGALRNKMAIFQTDNLGGSYNLWLPDPTTGSPGAYLVGVPPSNEAIGPFSRGVIRQVGSQNGLLEFVAFAGPSVAPYFSHRYFYQLRIFDSSGTETAVYDTSFDGDAGGSFGGSHTIPFAITKVGDYWVQRTQRSFPDNLVNLLGEFGSPLGGKLPPPLRLSQRNDGLGVSGHPRLSAAHGATSTQLTVAPRVGGKSTYS